ncbi:integrase core domain-containing protein [Streptomyces sp. FXJ1.4098]|nr:integrase core domain-containing protein [Streptomyces sp. FXJ1.4098]
MSTPSACSSSTRCSSWRCAPAPSISSASPPTPPPHGPPSRPDSSLWQLGDRAAEFTHLIRHRDTKFTAAFDTVFTGEDSTVAKIPPHSPNCNPHAERFIHSAREECTARVLLFDRGHAEKILHDYAHHFNNHRPHQGRDQLAPTDNPNAIPPARSPDQTPTSHRRPHQRVPPSQLTIGDSQLTTHEAILKRYGGEKCWASVARNRGARPSGTPARRRGRLSSGLMTPRCRTTAGERPRPRR